MRAAIFAAVAFSALVAADDTANPFDNPEGGYTFTAGSPTTLTWDPTTSGTIDLRLQWDTVTTPETGESIVSDYDNTGSYTWDVPSDLVAGREYTVEILDSSDTNDYNFLPYFTVAGATASASATATSTSSSSTSTSTSTTSTSTSTSSSSSTTATSTSTSSASSTTLSTKTSTKTSTSASSTKASSTATSTSSSSSSSSASSTASETSVPTANAGGVTRVSGGLLAVAAGAAMLL
ncbi:uncharacterized protein N7483_003137 [Penicillium malachiteum]|uniref:uncharacterized protein n=1 Tax=Penicillium malachiteum TaxID=1324776 RepID=UPI002548EB55|nr:uncharacterized protein N7483_003137 [Penicillium malachiteum]KAJ5728629.1 hypothetical protein N7483_003137 [Penicillium malachiteum]